MSCEKYATYTDAFREFRMNIAENDFHDNYPETAEMTLAICSGLRYHYMRNYRSLTPEQSIQLIETFSKRCVKLKDYKNMIDRYTYTPRRMIMNKHWLDDKGTGFNEWLLLCYMYGLIDPTHERKVEIQWSFAYMNTWAKRNTIQLKLLDRDIRRRIEIQQKLSDSDKLVNRIDEFNHLFKYLHIPSVDLTTGDISYKYVIDSYYDEQVDEKLGTDTVYEWILNDDVNRFQQWYVNGGLNIYSNSPRSKDKTIEFRMSIATHILSSNAVKITRYIIMNRIPEFLNEIHGMWALMDPWRYPVNDPECFRLLQECFKEKHKKAISLYLNNNATNTGVLPEYVYRFIKPEIAMAIFNEMVDIYTQLTGESNTCFGIFVAISIAKYGHIEPVESLDWEAITRTLSDKSSYTLKHRYYISTGVCRLIQPRCNLINNHHDCLPFGMNPSTAVYIHDLFAENGLVRIDSLKSILRDHFAIELREDDQIDTSNL